MSTDAATPSAETQSPTNSFQPVETTEQSIVPPGTTEQVTQEQGAPAGQEQSESTDAQGTRAPEQYGDFTLPDGWEIADDDLSAFADIAREIDVDQAGAQKLVDLFVGIEQGRNEWLAEQEKAAEASRDAQWQEQLAQDPEIGGDKFPAAQANIKALEDSGVLSEEFSAYLVETGEFKNPVVIKQLAALGALLKEDPTRVPSGPGGGQDSQTRARNMFANSGHE